MVRLVTCVLQVSELSTLNHALLSENSNFGSKLISANALVKLLLNEINKNESVVLQYIFRISFCLHSVNLIFSLSN